jgi:exodeoxyribonuclease-1
MQPSFYWYDYETFGADPRYDRPAQFAGLRTDLDLNIVASPLVLYCQPGPDYLPQPEACLITGISPQLALTKGVNERQFIGRIEQEFSHPHSCVLGYNNIRFDDEVTRFTLYRNLLDPYGREWQNGNSRWDLIDLLRLTYALRPEGLNWPRHPDGSPSFRLEELTKANGISHDDAHDALADVQATLALARLLKTHKPKLYDYLYRQRGKAQVAEQLDLVNHRPVFHISAKYPASQACGAVVAPLIAHPTNKNGVIVYDLSQDPRPFFELTTEQINTNLYTPTSERSDGEPRIPLKVIHLNKCPVVVPLKTVREQDQQRLGLDLALCYQHLDLIKQQDDFKQRIHQAFDQEYANAGEIDPDQALYSGGFFSARDKALMAHVQCTPAEQLADKSLNFQDKRLPDMLFRYRARNFPDSLTLEEQQRWRDFCHQRLTTENAGYLTLSQYQQQITELLTNPDLNQSQKSLLKQLSDYGEELSC